MGSRVRRRLAHGFTLIEMVVALAILSLCMTVLYAGLHLSLASWRVVVHRSVEEDWVRTAQGFLRSRLESLSPFHVAAGVTDIPVSGTFEEVEFTGPAPQAMGIGELRYDVRLRRRRSGNDLVVRWRRTWDGRVDRVAGETWHEEPLLENVRTLELQYLALDPALGPQWLSSWNARAGAPALIRIAVEFGPTDRRRWPKLTIRPKIEADPQCQFDPVSQACRDL